MTTGNNTASFFENGTTEQFEYCFQLYPKVLQIKAEKRCKKPQELIRLDQWYQNELPGLIKGRGRDAHLLYDELVQTMKWKQTRGKFYPQLSYLVKVNTPRAVMQETKKAFRKLPNLEQAITALSNLKGVGTTMASALLAAASPDSAPFMADECLMAIPEIEGIDYTTKEYLNFVQHIQSTVTRLNAQVPGAEKPVWSPHRVELALWAHYVANDLSPELLEEMPGPGSGGGANATNGNNSKSEDVNKELDGGEDTNDVDDESLGAAGRIINNLTTESETENENTNSMPTNITNTVGVLQVLQDGDSNFVSNDSTSQEPIIDENTTQTTATTSTDDGEAGTPLVSDSESNIEAPVKANTVVPAAAAASAATVAATTAAATTATATSTESNANKTDDSVVVVAPLLSISNCSSSSSGGDGNSNSSCNNSNSSIGKNMNNVNNSGVSSSNNNNSSGGNSKIATNTHLVGNGKDNGNGNGTLLDLGGRAVTGGTGVGNSDSLDGENSNCLRSSANELYTDEEDRNVDESSNSNSRGGHKSVTPIINMHDGNTNTNTNSTTNTDNDSTLSSAAGLTAIGQKRTLHCAVDAVGAAGDSLEAPAAVVADIGSQPPEAKKIRSD